MTHVPRYAFVTLVTSDHYLPGALVVAAALRDLHRSPPEHPNELDPSEFHIVCVVTPETVDISTIRHLRQVFDVVVGVEAIEQDNEEGLRLLGRLDLKLVLTKLHVFRLTSYQKIIFLDADILPIKPISHLFYLESDFAAVPDVGWPDIFNSGFLVLEPSDQKFHDLMNVVNSRGSWDGGDQGVLNEWVGSNWHRLSFIYNTTPTAIYTYAPAYKRFGSQIHNVHFIGPDKPWKHIPFRTPTTGEPSQPPKNDSPSPAFDYPTLLNQWFTVYDSHYAESEIIPGYILQPTTSNPQIVVDPIAHRYDNVWDSREHQRPVDKEFAPSHTPFGLDELKRLAIEGSGKLATAGDEQSNYVSLPLEGRINLIHPRKPPVLREAPQLIRVLALGEGPQTPVRSITPMQMLPTPGPNEIPPAPAFRGGSLPPETPTYAPPSQSFFSRLQSATPTTPVRRTPGRASPPLLLWNPAVEDPPSSVPPGAHFPPDTYFPNVWDEPVHRSAEPQSPRGFFHIPEPPPIPHRLIQEGHYRDVIGESPLKRKSQSSSFNQHRAEKRSVVHGRHPSIVVTPVPASPEEIPNRSTSEPNDREECHFEEPHSMYSEGSGEMRDNMEQDQSPSYPLPDRSKVAPVFPWEQKHRFAPKRLFPRTDNPPPVYSIMNPPSPPPTHSELLPSKEKKKHTATRVFPPDSHAITTEDFPRTTTYENAWDAIPSIQKYASRLVKPVPQRTTSTNPVIGHSRKGSKGRWDDVEASSRDADADDEDEDEDESSSPHGAVSSQLVRTSRKVIHSKTYKTIGIQTMPKLTKNQCVQVQIDDFKRSRSSSRASKKEYKSQSVAVGTNRAEAASPRSLRVLSYSPTVSPSTTVHSIGSKSTEIAIPSPTLSPSSPALLPLPPQKKHRNPPKRRFDPARDVELFKKGSEEVLARFLKMDSWDNATPETTGQ